MTDTPHLGPVSRPHHNDLASRVVACAVVALGALTACAPVDAQTDHDVLLELHRQLVTTQMVDQDPAFLLANSVEAYTVVAPGGVVETRDQVIAGLGAFVAIDSVTLTREQVLVTGESAVIIGRLEVHGEIRGPAGGFGPMSSTTVFSKTPAGTWMATARALTPCHPRAIEVGLC